MLNIWRVGSVSEVVEDILRSVPMFRSYSIFPAGGRYGEVGGLG